MPFGIEPVSKIDRARGEAERVARDLAEVSKRQFESDYRRGKLLPSPFPDLDASTKLFAKAQRMQEPLALTEARKVACAPLITEARIAIKAADADRLYFALGPDLYNHLRLFTEGTRINYGRYITLLIKSAILQRREEVLLQFAKDNAWPKKLSAKQLAELRQTMAFEFDQGEEHKRFRIPDAWKIDLPFAVAPQQEATDLFTNEHKNIQAEEFASNLLEGCRQAKGRYAMLMVNIQTLENEQEVLIRHSGLLSENSFDKCWAEFCHDSAELRNVETRVQLLKSSGIAWTSLAELEGDESLLDQAVACYNQATSSKEKASLLRCIRVLTAHGSQLTSQANLQRLDWAAVDGILCHVAAPTPRVAARRVGLIKYTGESRKQVKSFWWKIFHSLATKEKRCQSVRAVVWQFFVTRELSWAQREQRILEAMQKAEAESKPKGWGGSALFNTLVVARKSDETMPLLAPGGGELRLIAPPAFRRDYGSTD